MSQRSSVYIMWDVPEWQQATKLVKFYTTGRNTITCLLWTVHCCFVEVRNCYLSLWVMIKHLETYTITFSTWLLKTGQNANHIWALMFFTVLVEGALCSHLVTSKTNHRVASVFNQSVKMPDLIRLNILLPSHPHLPCWPIWCHHITHHITSPLPV